MLVTMFGPKCMTFPKYQNRKKRVLRHAGRHTNTTGVQSENIVSESFPKIGIVSHLSYSQQR